jgi:hypothetical protein
MQMNIGHKTRSPFVHTMAGEVLSYVQGASLKDSAVVSVRFTNSLIDGGSLVMTHRQ